MILNRFSSVLIPVLLLVFVGCKEKEMAGPKTPEVRYEGAVYIGCHPGPYAFNMDSLITYCTSVVDLNEGLDSLESPCLYDELHDILSAGFDVRLRRGNALNMMELDSIAGSPDITEIPITIEGQEYQWGEYPYYIGYRLEWHNRTLRIQAANKWLGGCFHDLILWEVIVH